jgi:signal transduction histidine kinase
MPGPKSSQHPAAEQTMVLARELAGTRTRATERARIARELHDYVSQELFSVGCWPRERPGRYRPARRCTSSSPSWNAPPPTATREIQPLLLELRPAALAEGGLHGSLERLARSYRDRVGIDVRIRAHRRGLQGLDITHALLRIAQEALPTLHGTARRPK